MDISNFTRDVATSEGGQWVSDIPGMGELRLHVRGLGSKAFIALANRLNKAAPRDQRDMDDTPLPEYAVQVMGKACHEALLLDWDGLSDNGKPVPYNKALALKWLTDPEFRPFLDAVIYAAKAVESGKIKQVEALEKN